LHSVFLVEYSSLSRKPRDTRHNRFKKKNKKNKFKALALECQVSLNLFLSLLKTKKIIFSFYDGLFLVFFYACA
jgi:hypothetical protein